MVGYLDLTIKTTNDKGWFFVEGWIPIFQEGDDTILGASWSSSSGGMIDDDLILQVQIQSIWVLLGIQSNPFLSIGSSLGFDSSASGAGNDR